MQQRDERIFMFDRSFGTHGLNYMNTGQTVASSIDRDGARSHAGFVTRCSSVWLVSRIRSPMRLFTAVLYGLLSIYDGTAISTTHRARALPRPPPPRTPRPLPAVGGG